MHFYPHAELVVVGRNPEMADMSNPSGAIYGDLFYVVAANDNGDTRQLAVITNGDACEQAEKLAERLQARWDKLGKLPVGFDLWPEGRPVYGSTAYEQYGQADDVAWERRCEADEQFN